MSKKIYSTLAIIAVSFFLVLWAGIFTPAKPAPCVKECKLSLLDSAVSPIGNDEPENSAMILTRDIKSPVPMFSQVRDNHDRFQYIYETYPSGYGYGNRGGGS